jgi:hypothetical protein
MLLDQGGNERMHVRLLGASPLAVTGPPRCAEHRPYAVPMLRHVNLLTWNDETDQATIESLSQYLSGYADAIPVDP